MNVSICIPTCNRNLGLKQCILRMNEQNIYDSVYNVTIVVVDNSLNGSAEKICKEMQPHIKYDIHYYNEKRKGIPIVRNTAIAIALELESDFLVFIDDDEYPHQDWLENILTFAITNKSKIVAGPVDPVFENGCKTAYSESKIFCRKKYPSGTKMKMFATNNLLLSTEVFKNDNLWFDEIMQLRGGSDTDFSIRATKKGLVCLYCNEALVYETIPLSRCTHKWYFLRNLRGGANYSRFRVKYKMCSLPHCYSIVIGIARVLIGVILGIFSIGIWRAAILNSIKNCGLGLGLILGVFNYEYNEYAKAHKS